MRHDQELNLTLTIASLLLGLNGFIILFAPDWQFTAVLGYPAVEKLGMLRWSAGPLLGIAVGLWMARHQEQGIGSMLAMAATGSTIFVLTTLFSILSSQGGSPAAMWFYIALYTVFAAQFWRLYARLGRTHETGRVPGIASWMR